MNNVLYITFGLLILSTFVIRGFTSPNVMPGAEFNTAATPTSSLSSTPTVLAPTATPVSGSTTRETPQHLRIIGVDVEDDD